MYTIVLGNQGKRVHTIGPERRVHTIGPERRVYTIEASDPQKAKKKRRGRWWCVFLFPGLKKINLFQGPGIL